MQDGVLDWQVTIERQSAGRDLESKECHHKSNISSLGASIPSSQFCFNVVDSIHSPLHTT